MALQHGNVETDESWYPTTKSNYDQMDKWGKLGRLLFPFPLFAYPFYVSPARGEGAHAGPATQLACQGAVSKGGAGKLAPGMLDLVSVAAS